MTVRFHIFWITLLSSVGRQYHPRHLPSNQLLPAEPIRTKLINEVTRIVSFSNPRRYGTFKRCPDNVMRDSPAPVGESRSVRNITVVPASA
jgi:hypothetical protein